MKIALFLGAGASVPLDKPTTKQMKEKLTNYSTSNLQDEIFQSFIIHPKFDDIEYILQSVRDIQNFSNNNGGMYFFENGKNGIFRYSKATVSFNEFTDKVKEVAKTLEDKIFENYRWNRNSNESLLKIYGKIFEFLKTKSDEIHIFSTNYDKAIEQFCNLKNMEFICIDGFERNPSHSEFAKWTGNFNPITDGNKTNIFLYKLHGSLNWKVHVDEGLIRTNEESKPDDHNFVENMVIYPTISPKEEESKEPYRTIIEKFKQQMQKLDVCIVIGYSFRDSLNEIFVDFVSSGGQLADISPNVITDYRTHVLKMKVEQNAINEWKQLPYVLDKTSTIKGQIDTILIQKRLELETVEEIINDVGFWLLPKDPSQVQR